LRYIQYLLYSLNNENGNDFSVLVFPSSSPTDEERSQLINFFCGFPLVVFVLYIAMFKYRGQNSAHRWFTIHLFTVHLIQVVGVFILYYIYFRWPHGPDE
jgi:hypothetical protein